MSFGGIIGHSRQLAPLRAALTKGRLHHAYLFAGPEGVGKRTIALALAQAVHCADGDKDGCGRCIQCERIRNSNHPDVRFVGKLDGKKEITIQQIREIEHELRYRSFGGQRKIAVVDPAGAMNSASQNALLKTLEEPPENSLLILITPNAGELLPTLRSRCLRLSFSPLTRTDVTEYLKKRLGLANDEAQVVAAMSMGSIGSALNQRNQDWMEKRRSWSALLGELGGGDYQSAIAGAESLAGDREETLEFLRWAESWCRDLLVHGVRQGSDQVINVDLLQELEHQGKRFGGERALRLLDEIATATAAVQRNLNRRMVVEQFLFAALETR